MVDDTRNVFCITIIPRSDDDGYTANPRRIPLTYQLSRSLAFLLGITNARTHDYHPLIMTSSSFLIALHLHLRLWPHHDALQTKILYLCAIRLYSIIFSLFRFRASVPLVAHLHYQLVFGAWTNNLGSRRVLFGLVGYILDRKAINDCAITFSVFFSL